MSMKDKTMEILRTYLDSDFKVFPMAPRKTTLAEIKEVELELAVQFPPEFIAHLLGEGTEVLGERGLYIEVKEEVWPRPQKFDVGPFWTFLYGLYTYTAIKDSENWMQLTHAAREFTEHTGLKAVPIIKIIGDADGYCINEVGEIVQYEHETNTLVKTNMNFWEVFEKELKELRERKDRKLHEKNNPS
jgi:hypothetical protein